MLSEKELGQITTTVGYAAFPYEDDDAGQLVVTVVDLMKILAGYLYCPPANAVVSGSVNYPGSC